MKLVRKVNALLIFVTLSSCQLSGQEDYQKGLVLHYNFDRKNFDRKIGDIIVNNLGAKHPGRSNEATIVSEKKSGNSLRVRKNHVKTGYVEAADHMDFNSSKFTVAAWIKLEQTNSNGSVICKHDWRDGQSRGFVLRCYDGKHLNFTVGAGGWLAATGKTELKAHQWIHAVGAFDGANIKVYFNGRLDGTNTIRAPYTPSPYPIRIGHAAFSLDTHRKFDGKIDDVMIWKRTLNDKEILSVYKDQKDSRPPPMVAKDIEALVRNLGSKDFRKRKEAQQKLTEIGTEILPLLDSFRSKKEDLEINIRIKQIRQAIKKNTWH